MLLFMIDPMSRTPIYEQLTEQVEKLVLVGVLFAGQQMPSVRALSCELSINPNTVQKAYADLCARGVLCAVPGKGCFVSQDAAAAIKVRSRERLQAFAEMTRELKLAGVPPQDLLRLIADIYNEE